MTEESLFDLFKEFECTKVKIITFPLDHTVGYALFTSEEKFTAAFDALNKKKLSEDGKKELLLARPIYVAPSKKPKKGKTPKKKMTSSAAAAAVPKKEIPAQSEIVTHNDTVIVSNLPEVVNNQEALSQIFEGFKIMNFRFENGNAIVKLENADQAKSAIESLTDATVEGSTISISLYSTNKIKVEKKKKRKIIKKNKKEIPSKKEPLKPEVLFDFPAMVRNLPYSLTDESELKKELEKYKLVGIDIKIRNKKHSKGFAIVGFESEEERAAAEADKDILIGGRKIVISKLIRRKQVSANDDVDGKNKETPEEFVGVIHNLPFDITDEESIGEILGDIKFKSAYVKMRGIRSMGYAVVVFNNKEDLESAIKDVSGTSVNGRTIKITPPSRKK